MRRGNLPDGDHDKVAWKCWRDLLTKRHNTVTPRCSGNVPQRRYWVFHLRLIGDVLMGRRRYVPLRILVTNQRRRWMFHLRLVCDVAETNWWDVVIMSSTDVVFHRDVVRFFIWHVPATSQGWTERRFYDVLLPDG